MTLLPGEGIVLTCAATAGAAACCCCVVMHWAAGAWVKLKGFAEVCNSCVMHAQAVVRAAAVEVCHTVVGLQLQHPVEVLDGCIKVAQLVIRDAPAAAATTHRR